MEMLLELCSEKWKCSGLEGEVGKMTKNLLTESRTNRENFIATKNVTYDAVAANSSSEKRFQEFTQEAESTTTDLAQALQSRGAEINKIWKLVSSLENKDEDAEFELYGAEVCLQQVQAGQQKLQSAVSCVQNKISAQAAGLEKHRDYSVKLQDTTCERMLVELGKVCNG